MKLANRFTLLLAPIAVGFSVWSIAVEWIDYQDRTRQFAQEAMQVNSQELQILSLNELFGYYLENTELGYERDAARDLRDISELFRHKFEEVQRQQQAPIRLAFLDLNWQPLVDEIMLSSVMGGSIVPVFDRQDPQPEGDTVASWIIADIHETIVAHGNDLNQDSRISGNEIRGYIYGAYQLSYEAFRDKAWQQFIEKSRSHLLEVIVLILILTWIGRTISLPFKDFVNQLKSISELDFKTPFRNQSSIDELQVLGNAIEDMRLEILRQQTELIRARDQALDAAETKSRFLATMSHEIRTPMNGVLGMAQLLGSTNLSTQQHQYVDVIHSSGHTLLTLINDILDFSKIEEKQVTLEEFPFELWELILDLEALFNIQIVQPDLKIAVDIGTDVPRYAIGDPHRLRQVLFNLIGNAIKFTEFGYVTIRLNLSGSTEGSADIEFSVEDTGVGIPAEQQGELFQPFVQADSSTSRKFGGTGLGLSICDRLIDAMGGKITVSSTPGVGSRFAFTLNLPIPKRDAPALTRHNETVSAATDPIESLADSSILVAEDDEINRMYMNELLKAQGFTNFKLVADGLEVLRALDQAKFDLIVMDCQMPELDGYDTSREIRRRESATGEHRIPIIALTANAMPEDRERCLAAGMDDYLVKPLDRNDLQNNLAHWLAKSRGAPQFGARASAHIDHNAITKQVESLGADILCDLVKSYLADLPGRIEHISTVYNEHNEHNEHDDNDTLHGLVHSFKGNSGVVRATLLCSLCDQLMAAIKSRPSRIRALVTELEQEVVFVEEELKSIVDSLQH